ncbi:MAG: hypothetical protein KQH63_17805 [Desulfobulbaceae bacterium]|nr:hypothetical protein [Desulfobulbaceae bacterium]
MNCSTNFSSKALLLLGLMLAVLPACALVQQQPALRLNSLDSDKVGPQQAVLTSIRWTADGSGGSGELSYKFFIGRDSAITLAQEGPDPVWEWIPKKPGKYRIKVEVSDARGDSTASRWSPEYIITAPLGGESLIAVLPIDNLSGTSAPMSELAESFHAGLASKGFHLVTPEAIEQFRKKHRMRYTGGVNSHLSRAIREETGADALLITALEAYHERNPVQISLIARLVSSGSEPEILWMDSVGLSGDESPGLLGLNLITDPEALREKAVGQLTGSLFAFLHSAAPSSDFEDSAESAEPASQERASHVHRKSKYMPYDYFRSQIIDPNKKHRVAVIPMLNLAVRKNAGKIVSLHYVKELFNATNFKVVEPGLVREELLRFRAIMPAGPSLAVADLITSQGSLAVDLVLSGKVFDYQNISTNPKVDFSMQVIEGQSREVVFGARTFSTGNKGVYFFDFGKVYTAHKLLEEMTGSTTYLLSSRTLP